MAYKQSDYYDLKWAALLENGIITEGSGEFMSMEIEGKRRFFGHKKGEICLTWEEGYNPLEKYDCCLREIVSEKGYSRYATCPTDLIISVIGGYLDYKDLREAFSHVKVKIN